MKVLTIFFYLLLGLNVSEVNTELSNYETRNGYFSGEPAIYVYDNDITHIICFEDSICDEIGVYAPKEYYKNYQEYFDTVFIRVGDDMFFKDTYRIAFFKAQDVNRFFIVGYMADEYR